MKWRERRFLRKLSRLVGKDWGPYSYFPKGTRIQSISMTGEVGQPLRMSVDLIVETPVIVEVTRGSVSTTHEFGPQ